MKIKKTLCVSLFTITAMGFLSGCDVTAKGTLKTTASVYNYQSTGELGSYQSLQANFNEETKATGGLTWIPCVSNETYKFESKHIDFTSQGHGYEKMLVSNSGNQKVIISFSGLARQQGDGLDLSVPYEYQTDAEFVDGNWDDYKNGKSIRLRLTLAGQKAATSAALDLIKNGLKMGISQKNQYSNDVVFGEPHVKSYKCSGLTELEGNSKDLTLKKPDCEMKFKIKGSVQL